MTQEKRVSRFTMLIETVEQQESGIVVEGNIKGLVRTKDTIYIITSNGKCLECRADELEIEAESGYMTALSAENCRGRIYIKQPVNKDAIPPFSVVASIKPQPKADPKIPIENPYLLGISRELKGRVSDQSFTSAMIFGVVHSNYLVIVRMDDVPESDDDGKLKFTKDTKVGFVTIPDATLQGEPDPSKQVLPVFTDWMQLLKWTAMFKDGANPKTLIMPFKDIMNVFNGSTMTGVVVNPFSSGETIYLRRDMLESIQKVPAYQMEFGEGAANGVAKVTATANTKVNISIPKDSAELRKLRGVLSDYGCSHTDIIEIYLLMMQREGMEPGYYCIIDCEDGNLQRIAEELSAEIRPYLVEFRSVSFAAADQLDKLNDNMKTETLVHRRV